MLEQITAADHYELIKLIAAMVEADEFTHASGLVHFKIIEVRKNVFQVNSDPRVFLNDWEFMEMMAKEGLFYFFVAKDLGKTTLGYRAPKMMAEFIQSQGQWVLLEFEDFQRPHKTPAELRFEVSKDFENLKKFLA